MNYDDRDVKIAGLEGEIRGLKHTIKGLIDLIPIKRSKKTVDKLMFEIEDYLGGNVIGIPENQIDHMGLSRFLRSQLAVEPYRE